MSIDKTILLVDDETPFLLSVTDGLLGYAPDLRIHTSENGKQALEVLGSAPVDLVVTDLKMPEMDGFELLARMSKDYPYTPVIVMTAFGTPEIEGRIQSIGAVQYLEKPVDLEVLAKMVMGNLQDVYQGNIQGITLSGFLQLVEMEKKSSVLKIISGGNIGYLYIRDGELIDAKTGGTQGESAAYEILSWEHTVIEIGRLSRDYEKVMDCPLNQMLMEAFRLKDERTLHQDKEGQLDRGSAGTTLEDALGLQDIVNDGQKSMMSVPKKEKHMSDLKETLSGLAELEGIRAVCLVGRDGFLIDSINKTDMDMEMLGAISSGGFGSSESIGREIEKGAVEMVMIEYETGPVLFSPIGEDAFIVVVAEKSANLGLIRVKIKKHGKDLVTAGIL